MNKAEAESLLEEIAQDPRIAGDDFGHNMAVAGGIDGTYCVEVDFYPDPIKVFNNRDAWLKWKAEKIDEEQRLLLKSLDKETKLLDILNKMRSLDNTSINRDVATAYLVEAITVFAENTAYTELALKIVANYVATFEPGIVT